LSPFTVQSAQFCSLFVCITKALSG
jgi:hypothetical protein